MSSIEIAETGLRLAGIGQLALGIAHPLAVRRMGWSVELARVSRLNGRIFRGLFGYITAINVSFGLLCLLGSGLLLDGSLLARLVCGGIAGYWLLRLILQLFYYPWHEAPGVLGSRPIRAGLAFAFSSFVVACTYALVTT